MTLRVLYRPLIEILADYETRIDTLEEEVEEGGGGGEGGGEGVMLKASVTLTNEQIKNLPVEGVEIVAAPGAGKALQPFGARMFFDITAAYDNRLNVADNDDWLIVAWDGIDGYEALAPIANKTDVNFVLNSMLGTTGRKTLLLPPPLPKVEGTPPLNLMHYQDGGWDSMINKNLAVGMWTSDSQPMTGGHADNTLQVVVYYDVITL